MEPATGRRPWAPWAALRAARGALPAALLAALLAALPYPVLLAVGTALLNAQPARRRAAWLAYASTDLANLSDHPVTALLLSAFVTEGDLLAWTVLALAGLGVLAWSRPWPGALWRPPVLAFAVHVLATGVSQGITAHRIATGGLPPGARVMTDVGPSYLVVAALVAAVGYGTRAGRLVGALGFGVLAPSLFTGLGDLDVAAVGHVASIALALPLGALLVRRSPSS